MNATAPKAIYDTIGQTYLRTRQADPHILAALRDALHLGVLPQDAILVDVGAGTCNYTAELARDCRIVAIEPSAVMIEQAGQVLGARGVAENVRLVQATADRIPFAAGAFQRLVCILALHHFANVDTCVSEMMRVLAPGGRGAILTADPRLKAPVWVDDYFGFIVEDAREVYLPIEVLAGKFTPFVTAGSLEVRIMTLPRDAQDLFFLAGWARPKLYLDDTVIRGISHCAKALEDPDKAGRLRVAIARLAADLISGRWQERYGEATAALTAYDGGYRIITFSRGD
jgi:ubiquinone/menaquinone biosynthesis C-methylase UbiE